MMKKVSAGLILLLAGCHFFENRSFHDEASGLVIDFDAQWQLDRLDHELYVLRANLKEKPVLIQVMGFPQAFFDTTLIRNGLRVGDSEFFIEEVEQVTLGPTRGVRLKIRDGEEGEREHWHFGHNGMIYMIAVGGKNLDLYRPQYLKVIQSIHFAQPASKFTEFLKVPEKIDLTPLTRIQDPEWAAKSLALIKAIRAGESIDRLEQLLAAGADINYSWGDNALDVAVKLDQAPVVAWLLENGADLYNTSSHKKRLMNRAKSDEVRDMVRTHFNRDPRTKANRAMGL